VTMEKGALGISFTGTGLGAVMKPYLADILIELWSTGGEMSSREAMSWHHNYVKEYGGEAMSRASYINGLNDLVDHGILRYREVTGRGGYRRLYKAAMTPTSFVQWLSSQSNRIVKSIEKELILEGVITS